MTVDASKAIFYSGNTYDTLLKTGSPTVTIGGSGTWVTIASFSELGLTRPPKVLLLQKPSTTGVWRLPGGGTYFNEGRGPLIRVTNTAIQGRSYDASRSYNFKYWVLDSSMKAN